MKNLSLLLILTLFFSGQSQKPKVLIIGDSISIGYFDYVKKTLADEAMVVHNPGNARHTHKGLRELRKWVSKDKWDVIQFNWGLWDLCYRHPAANGMGKKDKINGQLTTSLKDYEQNLDSLVQILRNETDAKLIFVTTSYVPTKEEGRFPKDPVRYNKVAKKIMKKYDITINDIYRDSKKIHEHFGLGENDVHYTERGYNELGRLIVPVLRENL